jgi:hypothetical protein
VLAMVAPHVVSAMTGRPATVVCRPSPAGSTDARAATVVAWALSGMFNYRLTCWYLAVNASEEPTGTPWKASSGKGFSCGGT